MNLLSSATIFSFFTLISRVLGYLRDILIAIFLGASIFADAFFVAFRLPNTFRRLFAEGTFNAAFIPSYTSVKIENKQKGKIFADDIFSLLLLILVFIGFNSYKSKLNSCNECGAISLGLSETCVNCGADLNNISKKNQFDKKPSESTIEVKAEEIK